MWEAGVLLVVKVLLLGVGLGQGRLAHKKLGAWDGCKMAGSNSGQMRLGFKIVWDDTPK